LALTIPDPTSGLPLLAKKKGKPAAVQGVRMGSDQIRRRGGPDSQALGLKIKNPCLGNNKGKKGSEKKPLYLAE